MADNKQIKDGLGNLFTHRMRDVSAGQDGSFMRSMFLSTPYPLDYGAGGIFQHCAQSGVFLTGIATSAPIYSFMWPASTMLAAIQRLRIMAWCTTAAFAAGTGIFVMTIARHFTAQDTGGTPGYFADGSSRLRSTMAKAQANIMYSNNSPLTPGTRTLDLSPIDTRTVSLPTTAALPFSPASITLYEKLAGEHPLLLANSEGFEVAALVPGSGAWQFAITLEWAEIPLF